MIATSTQAAQPAVPLPQSDAPVVRPATAADDLWIENLHALAYGPGRFARAAFRVRERFPIDRSLSLVAEVDGVACGSVWLTPISVGGMDGYLLGPLTTHPNFRRRGAGKALAREAVRVALERGEGRFVLLVGDRDYYCPLGFAPAVEGAVRFPGPVDPKRVLVYAPDETMAARLSGPILAFGAGKQS